MTGILASIPIDQISSWRINSERLNRFSGASCPNLRGDQPTTNFMGDSSTGVPHGIGLASVVVLLSCLWLPSLPSNGPTPKQAASTASPASPASPSTIEGSLALVTGQGKTFAPESATVFLIYYEEGPNAKSDTAGGAFDAEQLRVALAIAEQTTKNKEEIAKEPKAQRENEYEKYLLESVDQGLKAAANWAANHEDKWQFISINTKDGKWSQSDLRPGRYKIIARGASGDLDAEWQTKVTLGPGETISVAMNHVKMGRRIKPPEKTLY